MMDSIKAFLGSETASLAPRLALSSVAISMVGCGFLALVLRAHFIRLATRSTGDRSQFGNTLVMVAMATTLVILTIKSSLALSLGLVGALSVIRFRTPIKEPEELSYLFLAVGLGVGMGAEVVLETAVAFVSILAVMGVLLAWTRRKHARSPMVLLEIETDHGVAGDALAGHLKESSLDATLVRMSAGPEGNSHWIFSLREATQGQLFSGLARLRATWPGARVILHQTTN
jgi:hypothetical protein